MHDRQRVLVLMLSRLHVHEQISLDLIYCSITSVTVRSSVVSASAPLGSGLLHAG